MSLSKSKHLKEAISLYKQYDIKTQVAKELCRRHNVEYDDTQRKKISRWLQSTDYQKESAKVLIYDIETTRMLAEVWRPGDQYISPEQIIGDVQIITVSYKWLGENKVHTLEWDLEKKCDKELTKRFLEVYNEADLVIGINNDQFDNRIVNTRALHHRLDVNIYVRSFDLYRKIKSTFKLKGNSMQQMAQFLGLEGKYRHPGLQMWRDIQWGNPAAAKEAMKEMVLYNEQDVVTTEDIYIITRPYLKGVTHLGVLTGGDKCSCPECGSNNIKLYKSTITPAGTVQKIMICKDDQVKFRISNSQYSRL